MYKPSCILFVTLFTVVKCQFLNNIHQQHKGCYKDQNDLRDLPYEMTDSRVSGSVEKCVKACTDMYYMYAGLQNGNSCFCGTSYGRYGPSSSCRTPCPDSFEEVCGGEMSISVYATDIRVPGPVKNIGLSDVSMDAMTVFWEAPDSPKNFIKSYHINVTLNKSFDEKNRRLLPREVELSYGINSTRLSTLQPGAQYNVSIAAASEHGLGPAVTRQYWTEIGEPVTPDPPKLVAHDHDHHGEIHIQFKPPKENPSGPITAYRVLVINETAVETKPYPEDEEPTDFNSALDASDDGTVRWWIAAELSPDWFNRHAEFVVGDGRNYGPYVNYGPLPHDYDFHISVGLVSSFNNVTKVSYAKVTHDQHNHENVVIFKILPGDDHHGHGDPDRDHYTIVHDDTHKHHPRGGSGESIKPTNVLNAGLIVAIALFSVVLVGIVLFYAYVRYRVHQESNAAIGDRHELTATTPSTDTMEAVFVVDDAQVGARDMSVSDSTALDKMRNSTWQIPRNFLNLSHEVVGRGLFGSVIRGQVSQEPGTGQAVVVQVVPGPILEKHELHAMVNDVDLLSRSGNQENVVRLIGICEEMDTIFIAVEDNTMSLKQTLLDSRALVHYPVYAEKHQRVSTIKEGTLMEYLIGAANGMLHLSKLKIHHRKLCCRNIALVNGVAKINSIGIADYTKPGQDLNLSRWMAPETFRSRQFSSKCDMWAFGVVLWEALTLGATPFADLTPQDILPRVSRGSRLAQPTGVSEEMYQVLLNTWMLDPDERPSFEELITQLTEVAHHGNLHINFSIRSGFVYEHFSNDLELN